MKQLSSSVAHVLSSTQVITSFTSIVKELIENSIDAGCTRLTIKLDDYGFEKIEVEDDGCGIKCDDAKLVTLSHSTSKITSLNDFKSLKAYGFRGEALSSLCSVANVMITTKTSDAHVATTYCYDYHGKITSSKPSAACTGTIVVVTNLFKNLPVRRQYYKSLSKRKEELKRIEHLLYAYGITHPGLRIALFHNRCQIWLKNSYSDCSSAISHIFGFAYLKNLKHAVVHDANKHIKMEAYLPLPDSEATMSSDKKFIIVNNRPVKIQEFDKLIKETVMKLENKEAKRQCSYPYILLITLSPADIDVNLEPNKTKLIFRSKKDVLALLSSILMEAYGSEIMKMSYTEEEITEEGNESSVKEVFEVCSDNDMSVCDKGQTNAEKVEETEKTFSLSKRYNDCNPTYNHQEKIASTLDNKGVIANDYDARTIKAVKNYPMELVTTLNSVNCDEKEQTNFQLSGNHDNQNAYNEYSKKKNDRINTDESRFMQSNITQKKNLVQSTLSKDSVSDNVSNLWSRGQLKDTDKNYIEPVTLLTTNNVKSTTVEENLPSVNPLEQSASKVSVQTLLDKWNKHHEERKKMNGKIVKKGRNLSKTITSVQLKASKNSISTASKVQRSKEIIIKFNLSALQEARLTKKSITCSHGFTPVGHLPNGAWICEENENLGLWNHYRAKEALIFSNLMEQHKIAIKTLDSPVELSESVLGGHKQWNLLTSLPVQPGVPCYYEYVTDQRLIMNGIHIKKWYDDSINSLRLEITGLADCLPFYGILDLKSILNKILENPLLTVFESRPLKVINYLKGEAVRLVRTMPSTTNKHEIIQLYKNYCCEKSLEQFTCLHNKPVFFSFYKINQENTIK